MLQSFTLEIEILCCRQDEYRLNPSVNTKIERCILTLKSSNRFDSAVEKNHQIEFLRSKRIQASTNFITHQ